MKPIVQYLAIIILISSFSRATAQQLIGLDYNPAIKKQLSEKRLGFKSTGFTAPFPEGNLFFDDFSTYGSSVYPNLELWEDIYAFINQTYPDSCISYGVATLDAMDEFGNIYAVNDNLTPSDTLTSMEMQLDTVTGNVYLSFFVQGGGKGDAPDTKDSLIVEFYKPDSAIWRKVWYTLGYYSHTFEQIIIQIDPAFKTAGFRFRFRNYTSLVKRDAPGEQEGALGNSDLWHIDYVQVKPANDANAMKALDDVAMVGPVYSSHQDYNSIPYTHFEVAMSYRRSYYPFIFRTYFPFRSEGVKVTRNIQTNDLYNHKDSINFSEGLNLEVPFKLFDTMYYESFNPYYSYIKGQKYGHFEIVEYVKVDDINQYKWNDTLTREEIFKDYYALDDGTAEYGYGMPGNGGDKMRLANMFNLYTYNSQDTLTAVEIYFPRSRNNAHKNVEFAVGVWKAQRLENGSVVPGELLYPVGDDADWSTYFPDTTLDINEFMRINLKEDLIVSDTIFVGVIQFGTDFINIGYDINSDSRSRIRYNDGNGWLTPLNSIPTGSLMIRPVFGHKIYNSVTETLTGWAGKLKLYPNPAQDYIALEPENFTGDYENYSVSVFNILGKSVISHNQLPVELDIANLQSGMYIVHVIHEPSRIVYMQKFLKTE